MRNKMWFLLTNSRTHFVLSSCTLVVRSELELELAVQTPHINLKHAHTNR